jgi:hypothetical protein
MSRSRPAPRWCNATTGLEHFAVVTWATDPDRLAACLPPPFEPDVRAGVSLLSAVAFDDDRFRFNAAPWPRLSCGQVNYRAYVRRGDETGVWFFGTSLDSPLVVVPRVVWKMPWRRDRLRIEWEEPMGGPDGGGRSWGLEATGAWGAATVALRGTGRPFVPPAGFADADEVSTVLLDPFVGWFSRTDGSGVGRYTVWHEPLALEQADVTAARVGVFVDLGLIGAGDEPVAAGIQRRVRFDVHTPPTRVRD